MKINQSFLISLHAAVWRIVDWLTGPEVGASDCLYFDAGAPRGRRWVELGRD